MVKQKILWKIFVFYDKNSSLIGNIIYCLAVTYVVQYCEHFCTAVRRVYSSRCNTILVASSGLTIDLAGYCIYTVFLVTKSFSDYNVIINAAL